MGKGQLVVISKVGRCQMMAALELENGWHSRKVGLWGGEGMDGPWFACGKPDPTLGGLSAMLECRYS